MALWLAGALFVVFAANLVAGSFFGGGFLRDIGEMLLLLAASIAFVAAILQREDAARRDRN